jgi:arylsulfatase A-like enzyme
MEPHTPLTPDAQFHENFRDASYKGPELNSYPISHGGPAPLIPPFERAQALPPAKLRHLLGKYDAEIATVDASIGELMQALQRRGLYDRTLVILTADHGEEFYDHQTWGHGQLLFQELLHVPLVMKLPGSEHAWSVLSGVCRHVAILPTVLDLLGVEEWKGIEGESMAPAIRSKDPGWRGAPALSEMYQRDAYSRAYVRGDHKLLHMARNEDERWLLFDLKRDRGEQNPLNTGQAALLEDLKSEMKPVLAGERSARWKPDKRVLGPNEAARLRALGYLQE